MYYRVFFLLCLKRFSTVFIALFRKKLLKKQIFSFFKQ
jgi:hypothetical protein